MSLDPKMQDFLETVRQMVLPRIPSYYRDRAAAVPIVWDFYDNQRDLDDPLDFYKRLGHGGIGPVGEVWYKKGDPSTPEKLCLYIDGNLRHIPFPYGRVIAFTLIHELAHAACACSGNHEDPHWVQLAKDMGIREEAYSLKGPNWRYAFEFEDTKLETDIRKLLTYPGDLLPKLYD